MALRSARSRRLLLNARWPLSGVPLAMAAGSLAAAGALLLLLLRYRESAVA